jgi:hypothetical protein
MGIGEGDVHREVAADKKTHAGNSELTAHEEDVFCVVKASAMWACGVVRGSGSVTE